MTTVEILRDPPEFAARAGSFLGRDPLRNTVVGAMVEARRTDHVAHDDHWIVVSDDGEVVGAGMCTEAMPAYLLAMPSEAATELAGALFSRRPDLTGVRGDVEAAETFAAAWCARTGGRWTARSHKRLFRLGRLRRPADVSGELRAVTADELPVLADWSARFVSEAAAGDANPTIEALRARVGRGLAWMWWDDDGGQERPVSYVGHTVPAHGVQRIGPVYTPPDHRGRGYASACTAAVAAGLRERGAAEVCLYTDVANPTSNKIYQAIGFEPLHDTADLAFT